MFANIVVGFLLISVWVAIMLGSRSLVEFFGDIHRAVKNLGSTRAFYALVWFALCVFGSLFVFGVLDVVGVQESSVQGIGGFGL